MISINYRDGRPIYEQVKENLRQLMVSGILSPGDKLTSVRELAGKLAINPNTIQRAYRELEAAGWIATVAGKGCFVHSIPAAPTDRQALLSDFDQLTAALLASGMTREELIRHLREGGK